MGCMPGNITALIPRAAQGYVESPRVRRVKAATLDQRSCDPGMNDHSMWGPRASIVSSCPEVSCGEVSGRCSAHLPYLVRRTKVRKVS
jgi:hypothetical protein